MYEHRFELAEDSAGRVILTGSLADVVLAMDDIFTDIEGHGELVTDHLDPYNQEPFTGLVLFIHEKGPPSTDYPQMHVRQYLTLTGDGNVLRGRSYYFTSYAECEDFGAASDDEMDFVDYSLLK
jgi:hypothetical protein